MKSQSLVRVRNGDSNHSFVPVEYEGLSNYSKPFARYLFCITRCSLIEYIGVEWSTRIPIAEHLTYLTNVFDTLAAAGNDGAACSAFDLITFHILHTKAMMYREDNPAYVRAGSKNLRKRVYHRERPSKKDVNKKLRKVLLEFIRERFWMMPVEQEESVPTANLEKAIGQRVRPLMMAHTRKAMITAVTEGWAGVPHDVNDELAFLMLSDMSRPGLGVCTATAAVRPFKELDDHIHVTLSEQLSHNTTWVYDTMMGYWDVAGRVNPTEAWLYWMTLGDDTKMSETLRRSLKMNRARLMGHQATVEEMRVAVAASKVAE